MSEATPRPWRVVRTGDEGELIAVKTNEGVIAAFIGGNSIDQEVANAALIVKAVNLFDEMVKALETAQAALSDWAVTYAVDEFPGDAFKDARKRIAEHSGTLGYIADVSSAIRSVLSRIQDTDKPGRSGAAEASETSS